MGQKNVPILNTEKNSYCCMKERNSKYGKVEYGEGRKEGRKEGRAEGREVGREEGRKEGGS